MSCADYGQQATGILFAFLRGELTQEQGEREARALADRFGSNMECEALDPAAQWAIRNHLNGVVTTFEYYRGLAAPAAAATATAPSWRWSWLARALVPVLVVGFALAGHAVGKRAGLRQCEMAQPRGRRNVERASG